MFIDIFGPNADIMFTIDWLQNIYKWLSVIVFSMLKFVGGPVAGFTLHLSMLETIFFSILGMMISVVIVSTSGLWIRNNVLGRILKKKPIFSKKNRKIVQVWNKYGIVGVAALTPILFTPIGGTAIVVSFGVPLHKIWLYMFAAALFWGISITTILYYFGAMLGVK